ncbi:MAG TPA: hypothetical protein ENN68_07715 [Methanomicrobia archaeon]|nr:hypothetical protein [Methanomicrobia archaeon]
MKRKLIAGILALALIATAFAMVSAQITNEDTALREKGGWFGGHCGLGQLTDEERQGMHQQMEQFRLQLAEQYGVTLTDEERQEMQNRLREKQQEQRQELQQFQQELAQQYGIALTDEERQELQQKMQQFRLELAEQYGIDLPDEGRPGFPRHCGANLTDEEREAIQQQIQEFHQELFEQYGISCPAGPQFAGDGGHGPRGPVGRQMLGFQRGPGFGECPFNSPELEGPFNSPDLEE